ncbi:MAG TPA: LysR substrate-binding domain-containing protein [Trinickia sp.]|uniref:LysR family transcriptional regulator n=1 Tax=Trinickia sp. TaxID=2571163 RepID=UPI002D1DCC47|nr:LysR substrate-binding domain-containing protein [Trinickia sp.]HVW50852.1 LysR substrate-binding domain-containing protein [Trinickia sp.]
MLRAFVAAARHRSFSKAAVSLGVTTGSISKAIAKLEAALQVRLLHRTTRSVVLTEVAQPYFLSCCRLLEELDEANRRIVQERTLESGALRLAVHPTVAGAMLARLIGRYRRIAPNVNLIISAHDESVRLYDGKFDVAILPPHLVEQSTVIRRTLSRSARRWVASPRYMGAHGTPKSIADLSNHVLLLGPQERKGDEPIKLLDSGRTVKILPKSSMTADDMTLRTAAIEGMGIALLPESIVRADVASGLLLPVLPDCTLDDGDLEICLFYSHRELLPARLRTFIDFCIDFFRDEPAENAPVPLRRAPVLAVV